MKILAALAVAVALSISCSTSMAEGATSRTINGFRPAWWKQAVVYEVYPRSFKDSNGDGIGDINGITQKLDYLHELGVDVIWICPFYDSSNVDGGYDVRDYRKIDPELGTMADFDRMLAAIHQRHMRLIIDLPTDYTSVENRWFIQSASSKANPYRDYYIWRDGKPDPSAAHGFDPPNNYTSFFGGSAWAWNERTKQFYLHLFAAQSADLNWDNPRVRQRLYSIMRFWLNKGVDGFRLDVITLISKQPGLPDLSAEQLLRLPAGFRDFPPSSVYANGPRRNEYLREMNREVFSRYHIMTVGEATGITLAQTPAIVDENRHELDEVFNFDAARIDRDDTHIYGTRTWTVRDLKAIYDRHAKVLGKAGWDTVFLSNHDNSRLVSTFGDDSAQFRESSAKLLETMILTLRGTPYLYQGDELGMTNFPWSRISQFNDIEVQNAYKDEVITGHMTVQALLAGAAKHGRDNARTPMQWNATAEGGFTSGSHTWEPVNPNYTTINAAAEIKDPHSVYNYTRQAIALHHASKAFTYGGYKDLDPKNEKVFAYTRTLGEQKYLIVLNFSKTPTTYVLPNNMRPGALVLGNLRTTAPDTSTLHLGPFEARVYKY